eukprot:3772202-Prymnesium_polylepis.1
MQAFFLGNGTQCTCRVCVQRDRLWFSRTASGSGRVTANLWSMVFGRRGPAPWRGIPSPPCFTSRAPLDVKLSVERASDLSGAAQPDPSETSESVF